MPVLKNKKHEAVLQAWIADPERVGWRAYKSVYRKSSQHAAETAWSRLLKIAEFKARSDELSGAVTASALSGAVMSATEVLEGLTAIARGNIQDVGHLTVSDNVVEELRALPRSQAAAISELTVVSYNEAADAVIEGLEEQPNGGALRRRRQDGREVKRVKLKLHDKRAALVDLGRYHKLFGTEHELGGNITVVIRKFSDGAAGRKAQKRAA